ncbi:hypothetical protein AAHA92_18355 [Salvia divinorum]|uniref:Uncharacterized protein n=1 Tax=Salvia divinorum TaxID=28513 RepID=A0ABD1H1U8_SALDI
MRNLKIGSPKSYQYHSLRSAFNSLHAIDTTPPRRRIFSFPSSLCFCSHLIVCRRHHFRLDDHHDFKSR